MITVIEYFALLNLIFKLHRLRTSVSRDRVTWVLPERSGVDAPRVRGRHRVGRTVAA